MFIQSPHAEDPRSRALGISLVGLLLIVVGLTWMAGNLGVANAHYLLKQYWPAIFVVLGAAALLRRRHDQVMLGLVLIFFGGWAYAAQQQLLHVPFWAVFGPTLLVLAGGSVIWRAFHRPGPETSSDAYIRTFAVLSGGELRPTVPFEGADITAVMGGAKLDLSSTPMARESATIDVFALMGGAEIIVPRDWDVTFKVAALMGGCVDKRRPASAPPAHHLILRGLVMMGGVEVKD